MQLATEVQFNRLLVPRLDLHIDQPLRGHLVQLHSYAVGCPPVDLSPQQPAAHGVFLADRNEFKKIVANGQGQGRQSSHYHSTLSASRSALAEPADGVLPSRVDRSLQRYPTSGLVREL